MSSQTSTSSQTESRPIESSSTVTDAEQQVLQRAKRCFATSAYFALRRVACAYHEGVLILRGRVPSFYLKQVAQTIVKNAVEGIQIDNRIEVKPMS